MTSFVKAMQVITSAMLLHGALLLEADDRGQKLLPQQEMAESFSYRHTHAYTDLGFKLSASWKFRQIKDLRKNIGPAYFVRQEIS